MPSKFVTLQITREAAKSLKRDVELSMAIFSAHKDHDPRFCPCSAAYQEGYKLRIALISALEAESTDPTV